MHAARAGMMALLVGCAAPEGLWRDQYIFVGDDGTVLPLCLQRVAGRSVEAKGWLGADGAWQTTFYRQFPLGRIDPRSARDVALAFSALEHSPARLSVEHTGAGLELGVRTPSAKLTLRARALQSLGESSDPEGTSVYSAGRGELLGEASRREGWVLCERTPTGLHGRRPLVDYGDFLFVAVAAPRGPAILAKHGRSGFDHAVAKLDSRTLSTDVVAADLVEDRLTLALPDAGLRAELSVRDRIRSRGVAPDGTSVAYETLLLDGAWRGVAFAIHREVTP